MADTDVAAVPVSHRTGSARSGGLMADSWLLLQWMRRDYVVRYRQSILGLAWAIIQPLFLLAFYGLIFRNVLHVSTPGVPYVVFAFTGLAPWTFLATAVTLGVSSIYTAQGIVTKVWFPREIIPLAAVGVSLIDLAISSALMLVLTAILGPGVHLTAIAIVPTYIELTILTSGLVILGSALNVFFRDLRQGVPLLLQVAFIATPVMYATPRTGGALVALVRWNPVTTLIEATRSEVALGHWPTAFQIWYPLATSMGLLVLSLAYFRAVERRFPDVL